jgi:hypothetical protein
MEALVRRQLRISRYVEAPPIGSSAQYPVSYVSSACSRPPKAKRTIIKDAEEVGDDEIKAEQRAVAKLQK